MSLCSVVKGLTNMKPTNFFSLPSELRNKIYELCLLHHESIDPWAYRHWRYIFGRDLLNFGLLRVNKLIHHEASSFFYSRNHFNFTTTSFKKIISFLTMIGHVNAKCIQHLSIKFPALLCSPESDLIMFDSNTMSGVKQEIEIAKEDIARLELIESYCPNLTTLTTPLPSEDAMRFSLDTSDNNALVREALILVDARFRALSSALKEIIIHEHADAPKAFLRSEIQSHGWIIRKMSDSGKAFATDGTRFYAEGDKETFSRYQNIRIPDCCVSVDSRPFTYTKDWRLVYPWVPYEPARNLD